MTNTEYSRWENYPTDEWRWKDFHPRELISKSDGKLMVDPSSMDKLQALRDLLGKPIHLTSAYRSPAHNKKIGGAKSSYHMKAMAYDCQMRNQDPATFLAAAKAVGFTGFGFYKNSNFIHVDTGPTRSWGVRWFDEVDLPKVTKPTKPLKAPATAAAGGLVALGGAMGADDPMVAAGLALLAVLAVVFIIWKVRKP